MAFFTTLILALYPSRFERPWLFALAVVGLFNTQMLAFTFAAGIGALYGLDALQQKRLKGSVLGAFALMCIGGAYLIPYLVMGSSTAAIFRQDRKHAEEIGRAIGSAFFTLRPSYRGVVAFVLMCICLMTRPKALLVLAFGLAGIFYILGYNYYGEPRHHGVIMLVTLCAIGLSYYYSDDRWNPVRTSYGSRIAAILFTATLLVQIRTGFRAWIQDNKETYSDAKGAAAFLKQQNLTGAILVGHKSYVASSMLPFLPKDVRLFFAECSRWGTYIIYDTCHFAQNSFPPDFGVRIADSTFFQPGQKPSKEVVLVLSGTIQEAGLAQDWKLVYYTPRLPLCEDEQYFIYRRR